MRLIPKLKTEGPTVEERIDIGNALLRERRLLEALAEFEVVLQEAPEFNFIHIKVGQIHFQRRSYRLALDSFHQAMELDKLSAGPPQSAGWVYLKLREMELADQYFRISVSIDPAFDAAFVGLGQVAMLQHQYAEAVLQFQQALALNPTLLSGQMGLAEAYRCQGLLDEAIAVLDAVPEKEPNFAFACVQLGRLYREKHDYAIARATFQKARDANPIAVALNGDAQLDLIESFLVDHSLDAAIDTLQETPDFLKLAYRKHQLQGNLHLQQGLKGQAFEQYLMAWQLNLLLTNQKTDRQDDLTTLQDDLELQLALKQQDLNIRYQAIASLDDCQAIVGLSSLLEWQRPTQGRLVREQFLPIAERTGLMLPIGWWELYEACQQLGQMRQHLSALKWVGVNLSVSQLQDPDLVTQVMIAVNSATLDSQALLLEIDGLCLLEMQPTANLTLEKLHQLPCQVAAVVDNTDSSIFELLRRYPFQFIKLKPNVIQNLSADENCTAVSNIVGLSIELGIETVAVGVETVEQATKLRSLGCQYAQGPLFGDLISGHSDDVPIL
jgi:EAL domain-containing protein (putative c-di-GMP-specific phosphodiesterase class I)/tetratricopeptide (TPR) repeat protein